MLENINSRIKHHKHKVGTKSKNFAEVRSIVAYLTFMTRQCKVRKESFLDTLKHTSDKSKLNNQVIDYDRFSLLVPRSRAANELSKNCSKKTVDETGLTDYQKFMKLFDEVDIRISKIWVGVQEELVKMNVLEFVKGYWNETKQAGKRKSELSQLTIKDIIYWDNAVLQQIPIDGLIKTYMNFGELCNSKIHLNFWYNPKVKDSYYKLIKEKAHFNIKTDIFYASDFITYDPAEYIFLTQTVTKYNLYNSTHPLTNNVASQYFKTFFINELDGSYDEIPSRIYSRATGIPKIYRHEIMRLTQSIECDQSASLLNSMKILMTGNKYEKHPYKQFIKLIFNLKRTHPIPYNDNALLQKVLYNHFKQLIILGTNCSDKKFRNKIKEYLIRIGLYDPLKVNSYSYDEDGNQTNKKFSSNEAIFNRQVKFAKYIRALPDYKDNISDYEQIIDSNCGWLILPNTFYTFWKLFFHSLNCFHSMPQAWLLTQSIDSNYAELCYDFSVENNIPYIQIHDAIVVPVELNSKATEFMESASMISALQWKADNEYKSENQYINMVNLLHKRLLSKNTELHFTKTNLLSLPFINRLLTTNKYREVYIDKVANCLSKRMLKYKKYIIKLANGNWNDVKTNSIVFNSIVDKFCNNVRFKSDITIYLSTLPTEVILHEFLLNFVPNQIIFPNIEIFINKINEIITKHNPNKPNYNQPLPLGLLSIAESTCLQVPVAIT